jgi:uncharacterized protein YjdB
MKTYRIFLLQYLTATLALSPFFASGALNVTDEIDNRTVHISLDDNENYAGNAVVSGEMKQYHKLTLTWDAGVSYSETDLTFTDYRLDVTFQSPSGKVYVVPGYFAADGDAGNTSASNGNMWRCNFNPLEKGTWSYSASFKSGANIVISETPSNGTSVAPIDGDSGTFDINGTDKIGKDFRSKGKLEYVGEHFQRWSNGEYFLKIGSNSPENLFEYNDIDNYNGSAYPRTYDTHLADWNAGDPTWKEGKGKALIGLFNYLNEKGINSQYFVMHRKGDRSSPWVNPSSSFYAYDVSKLDQMQVVFDHMMQKGIMAHIVLSESTNQSWFEIEVPAGDPMFADARKIYIRELVARFGYLNAVTWNIGEENGWDRQGTWAGAPGRALTTQQQLNFAAYVDGLAYYNDGIVIHNGPSHDASIFDEIQGNNSFTGISMQGYYADGSFERPKLNTQQYRNESTIAGKKWVVCYDEAFAFDPVVGKERILRERGLWAAFTAGAAGFEHYSTGGLDITQQDMRVYEVFFDQMKHAYDFYIDNNLPFQEMYNQDELVEFGWLFGGEFDDYVVYARGIELGKTTIDLIGDYEIKWYNPRTGGALVDGSIMNLSAGNNLNIGVPPTETDLDWVALIRSTATGPINVTRVDLQPNSMNIGVGSTFPLSVKIEPANADDQSVSYSSSNPEVVSVTTEGVITGLSIGQAVITVTTNDGGFSDSSIVTVVNQSSTCDATGTLLMEKYNDIEGTRIYELVTAPNYPDNPSETTEITLWEIPERAGDNYGVRLSGYMCVPESGLYTFWIAGDDNVQLNMSPDEQPENAQTIAFHDAFTNSREWNKYTTQRSDPILLLEGQQHYIEALMKEGGFGDFLAVGWRKPSDGAGNEPSEIVPGSVMSVDISVAVSGVTIDESIEIEQFEEAQLTPNVFPSNADDLSVTWSSSDESVVTVNADGVITGIGPGQATVEVTTNDGNFTDEIVVTVIEVIIDVSGITVDPTTTTINIGEIFQVNATVEPSNATNPAYEWTSSDRDIATVDDQGVIVGKAEGVTTILATTIDGGFIAEITVTVIALAVSGISVSESAIDMYQNTTRLLTYQIEPSNATNQEVVWSSDDSNIVAVSPEGLITAQNIGTTTVNVTTIDGGFVASTTVTVLSVIVTGLSIDATEVDIYIEESRQLTALVEPANATDQSVIWSTDDPSIVTVDDEGNIVGVSPGVTIVRATTVDGGYVASTTVTVLSVIVTGVTIDTTEVDIDVDQSIQLTASVEPADATDPSVIWSTDDASIVTVDNEGNILGVSPGVTTVRATSVDGGYVGETTVTVSALIIFATGVSLNVNETEIQVNGQLQIFAEILPSGTTDQSVVWSSDDPTIVTVDAYGNLSGVAVGTTIVRVTTNDGGYTAEVIVSVVAQTFQVTGISITPSEVEIFVGQQLQIIAEILPTNATNQSILWSSEDSTIATVNTKGAILGEQVGTTVITATTEDGNFVAQTVITVLEAPIVISGIRLDYNSITLEIDQTITLIPTILPENAENTEVIWSTDDSSVISVDSEGNITGLSEGTTVIRVATPDGEIFAEIDVVVFEKQVLSIFPNPADDFITVTGVDELLFVSIYSSNGQILQRVQTKLGGTRISIDYLPPGIYFIGLDFGTKIPFIKR